MSASVSPNAVAVASELSTALKGKLEQPKLDALIEGLKAPAATYTAIGTTINVIFYIHVACGITSGRGFNGNAGGFAAPPGGTGGGQVYTNDIDRLYRDTVAFSFVAAVAYLGIQFFDKDHNLLGHYEGGGLYTPATGGGSGSF
ncbi:Virulence-associated family protein OS=Lacinutrix sp. (strain 5H-3-7-4) GN=Lacal_1267 PE=4 SV=1: R_equi_Vir [Gemmata massiliana]|uniref:Uncharacterized protein n=1 Tax=Gemmata massiliana TaxID=1210884 RepID=A0A6P2CZQ7_9BACT|nr:VapA/VapB family virulence-associated protein [Gemmata massiliana]VTR93284.1 Virulence-associated family protein OS=Lacinutrix sp. (strain 5H-3-7-4) GN=Lacal_1267 PE=4 SV=1: R_equi_Vir [Gemmata massiliana]